eukprot:gene9104-55470_t
MLISISIYRFFIDSLLSSCAGSGSTSRSLVSSPASTECAGATCTDADCCRWDCEVPKNDNDGVAWQGACPHASHTGSCGGCTEGQFVIHGTVCGWEVEDGWTCPSAPATSMCDNGTFSFVPTCVRDRCGPLAATDFHLAPDGGFHIMQPSVGELESCNRTTTAAQPTACDVTCVEGWDAGGRPPTRWTKLECREGGWFVDPPCAPSACDAAFPTSTTPNGHDYLDCGDKVTGQSCTPTCAPGFRATRDIIGVVCIVSRAPQPGNATTPTPLPPDGRFDTQPGSATCAAISCSAQEWYNATATAPCDQFGEPPCALPAGCVDGHFTPCAGASPCVTSPPPQLSCATVGQPAAPGVAGWKVDPPCVDLCETYDVESFIRTFLIRPTGALPTQLARADLSRCGAGSFRSAAPLCRVPCVDGYSSNS